MKLITSFWTVLIISISVAVIFLSFGLFHEFIPNMKQASFDRDFAAAEQTEADKMPQAKKRDQQAITIVKQKTAEWATYVATRTPSDSVSQGGIDISEDPYTLTSDTFRFRNNIQREVNAQLGKGGVKLVGSGPLIPLPDNTDSVGGILASYYHYPGIKFPVLIFNLGQIQVQGTYEQIANHIKSYKTMPHYLAVTDGLRFDGTAPILTATYNLSIVGFVRGKKVFGSIPAEASGGTSTVGGGSMAGMMGMGGMGGGRPGMGGMGGGPRAMGGMGGPPGGGQPTGAPAAGAGRGGKGGSDE